MIAGASGMNSNGNNPTQYQNTITINFLYIFNLEICMVFVFTGRSLFVFWTTDVNPGFITCPYFRKLSEDILFRMIKIFIDTLNLVFFLIWGQYCEPQTRDFRRILFCE